MVISERNLSSIDGNDSTAASDQTTRVRLQSPQEENKQPAARRSSKNSIYERLKNSSSLMTWSLMALLSQEFTILFPQQYSHPFIRERASKYSSCSSCSII